FNKQVTFIGVDVYEKKTTTVGQIQRFVDSMGRRMKYSVAMEDSTLMENDWLAASDEEGIPVSFIVNGEGRIAWIGYPFDLQAALPDIVNNTWDIKKALTKRNFIARLVKLDFAAIDSLKPFTGSRSDNYYGQPDIVLDSINKFVSMEPGLKYAPIIASSTFCALLKTNPQAAYGYGKQVLITTTYDRPAYEAIISAVESYSDKLTIPPEVYALGAEAWELKIDYIHRVNWEVLHPYEVYHQMAEWYWRASNKSKAIQAEKNAVRALKGKKLKKIH
ncbi:MAG TPA: hypothetical protein VKR53_04550, partial [Puia sp.]|nr:hypothetical protein [Puia sp.]